MNNSKAMGLGMMLLLLVLAVVFLPMIVRYIDKMESQYISGFTDLVNENMTVQNVPSIASAPNSGYVPDKNTSYLCASPNNNGQPCEEGSFCDGPTQTCIRNYVGGEVPEEGYYA